MNEVSDTPASETARIWRLIRWGTAACLLLLPLLAMQFTEEVNWTLGDFVFAAVAIGGIGLAFELALRVAPNLYSRLGFSAVLAGAFLMVWINAAVGIIGAAGNDVNVLYFAVLITGFAVGVAGRFRPSTMVRASLATALAQALLTALALIAGFGQPENSALEVIAINGFFMPFWLGAAALFLLSVRAAHRGEEQ